MTGAAHGGLSYVVRRGELRHRTDHGVRRFATTYFDDELLAAVDAAATAAVPLALVVPLPAADTPIVLGAAALAAEIVRTRSLDVTATVVSRRLSQRASYDQLFIGRDRLGDVIPRARLTIDGRLETIGTARRASAGRMVLTSDPVRAAGSGGALVVDGTGTDPGDLRVVLRRGRQVVYVTDNPFDATLRVFRDVGGVVWAFDPAALGQLATASDVVRGDGVDALAAPAELLQVAGSAERLVWAPGEDADLDSTLRTVWSALGHLAGLTDRTDGFAASHALRWAWGTIATFALSVTTPQCYDRHVTPGPYAAKLADAAGHARGVARNMTGEARDAWAAAADAFTDVHASAVAAPKLSLVESWLQSLADDQLRGLLVTRNRAAVAALTTTLDESPDVSYRWSDLVQVVSVRDVACGRVGSVPVDSMLVTGPVPRAYASLFAAPLAPQALMLAAGTWEATRAARQVTGTLRELGALREATVTCSSTQLNVPAMRSTTAAEASADEVTIWRDGTVIPATGLLEDPDGSPWEPFGLDLLAVITGARPAGSDDAAVVPPPTRSGAEGSTASVPAIKVGFTDGQCMLVGPNDLLYRRREDEARRVAAKSLAPGDIVALVDATARRDVFDSVIDVLSELPKYAPLGLLISFWHHRARAARARGYTHREILASMRSGTDRTSITSEQTIGTWIRGDSEGPEDPDDVRRFAVAVNDQELRRRADAVGQALRTSRIVHRAVGRWLSAQIHGAQLHHDDALIDPELGVHVADLLEAVSAHEVATVDPQLVTAPVGAVGVLLDPETVLVAVAEHARGQAIRDSRPAVSRAARDELRSRDGVVDEPTAEIITEPELPTLGGIEAPISA